MSVHVVSGPCMYFPSRETLIATHAAITILSKLKTTMHDEGERWMR